ncbi:MAG: sigma-54-dependent Fis family transcriptional regulator [Bdellovibrionaceae bacterium]|nr:sigma-54-dependent Fis family transcriptional regulator [Pseudobdellovibrionaceae bacterium]
MKTLLLLDDDQNHLDQLKDALAEEYKVITANEAGLAFRLLGQARPDLMIVDLNMPEVSGLDVLRAVKQRSKDFPVIVLTSESDPSVIVNMMKSGADDYVVKNSPELVASLKFRISNCLKMSAIKQETSDLAKVAAAKESSHYQILGNSVATLKLKSEIAKYKGTNVTVLIQGEAGTGKELIARTFHLQEGNIKRPFVAVNCGAIPENLIESTLFGHKKGSFTGATENNQGLFLAANKGDLFLDEIGELSLSAQVRLLRVLQEKVITPVGSEKEIAVDVRIIAATNRNLEKMVNEGKFREDLFYRLNKIMLYTTPLREKKEDIAVLAEAFIKKYHPLAKLTTEAKEKLDNHIWRGNIRELDNVIERACIHTKSDSLTWIKPDHLSLQSQPSPPSEVGIPNDLFPNSEGEISADTFNLGINWVEKNYLKRALQILNGDNKKLISLLGIGKTRYFEMKKNLGLTENQIFERSI